MKTSLICSLVMATALFATGASFAATAAGTQPVNASSADMKGAANQKVVFQVSAADPKNVKNIEHDRGNNRFGQQPGAVYVTTNQDARNEVVAFRRGSDGSLTLLQRIDTGGTGTGGPTESQDAVVLNKDHTLLFTVNVSSNDISVFSVDPETFKLAFVQRVDSGGDRPVSLDVRGDLLYVVNSGQRSGVSGFRIAANGTLTPIAGSIQPLSFGDRSPFGDVTLPCTNIFPRLEEGVICSATQPAEVEFSPDGKFLVVSERLVNQFSIYELDENGVAGNRKSRTSNGESPFGMHFTPNGQLLVAEAFLDRPGDGGVSSYNLTADGDTKTITDSLKTGQSTSCWIEVTPDGRFAYITNPGNSSITGLRIGGGGGLQLLPGLGGDDGVVAFSNDPRDLDITPDGRFLYVLNNVEGSVNGFRVNRNGTLDRVTTTGFVLPVFGLGLAAF